MVYLKDAGATMYVSITLDDPRVFDACLAGLIETMGFDSESQRHKTGLVIWIKEVSTCNDWTTEGLTNRLRPNARETDLLTHQRRFSTSHRSNTAAT